MNMFLLLINKRNQKCKVLGNAVIPQEEYKKANDCYRLLDVKCPVKLDVKCPVKIDRTDSKSKDAVCK